MLPQDNVTFINEIEKIHQYIQCGCQEYLSDLSIDSKLCSQRIGNAAEILYNDAARLARKEDSKLGLSLKLIANILNQIFDTLQSSLTLTGKEKQIADILRKYNLNPDQLLILNKWNDNVLKRFMY